MSALLNMLDDEIDDLKKQIQSLKQDKARLKELLKEASVSMGCHCSPMNHVCFNCRFKNKPEIKKIMSEGSNGLL